MPQALPIHRAPLCKSRRQLLLILIPLSVYSLNSYPLPTVVACSEEKEDINQSAEVSSLKMPAPSNSNNSSFASVLDRQQQQPLQQQQSQPEVDEDGYCIQPKDTLWDTEAAKKGKNPFSAMLQCVVPELTNVSVFVSIVQRMASTPIRTVIRMVIHVNARSTSKSSR